MNSAQAERTAAGRTTAGRTTADDISARYERDGFVFPLDVMSEAQAARYRRQLEELEQRAGDGRLGNKNQLNHPHVIFRFAYEIVTNPRILDAVEAVIGPNILIWGSTFFIKEPRTESYVSWHQDLRYWGLSGDEEVSAWLALGPVNRANGCMRFVPGSHKGELVPHKDTFDDKNFLTRGQEAQVDIEGNETVNIELAAGQVSLHHGKLLHSSGPNRSDDRRVGFTMNFIAAHMSQVVAEKDYAMLVRGEDIHGNFELVPPPVEDLSDAAMAWHGRVLNAQNVALYQGAEDTPR